MYDVLRADRCISSNSIEARVPFGDLDFVRYVMAIDPEKKLNSYGKGKYLLRKAFEGDWLPPEILWREKAAFSDAVGHSMVDDIKEYTESLYTDEEFQLRRANYSAHCMPFTKESLFYREIFEKYYHDQSRRLQRQRSLRPCAGKLRRIGGVIFYFCSRCNNFASRVFCANKFKEF